MLESKPTTIERYAESRAGRPPEMKKMKSYSWHMQKQWRYRGGHTGIWYGKIKVFHFDYIASVFIVKQKTVSSKKQKCVNEGSNGNLMPIRMYKMPFPQNNIDDLNKSISKKIVLHAYNNSHIPEMMMCSKCIHCTSSVMSGQMYTD